MNRYNLTACLLLQLALASSAHAQAFEFAPCPLRTIEVRGSFSCMTDYAPLYIYRDKMQKFSHVRCQYYRTDLPIRVHSCDYRGWCKVRFDAFDGYVPDTVITQHEEQVRSYHRCWRRGPRERYREQSYREQNYRERNYRGQYWRDGR
jgi:hypothetical protein